jgi:hypothetical protein
MSGCEGSLPVFRCNDLGAVGVARVLRDGDGGRMENEGGAGMKKELKALKPIGYF